MMKSSIDRLTFLGGLGAIVISFGCAPARTVSPSKSGSGEANPFGPHADPRVDAWLRLNECGEVTVLFGKVELGTGVQTAICQIAADALDVPIERVRVIQGDTAETPDQGYTAGSQTLTAGAIPVRQAAYEARRILVELGAQRLGVATAAVSTKAGNVLLTDSPARSVSYGTLLKGRRFEGSITGHTPIRDDASSQYVGMSVPRVDIPGKVKGDFPYVHNLRLPGMLHARVILPTLLGSRLEHVDATALSAIDERITIVRRGNVLGVVARTEWNAVRAARLIRTTWHPGPPLPSYNNLYDAVQSESGDAQILIDSGDVEKAMNTSHRTISARYQWPYQCHASIGPSCSVADVRNDSAEIWSSTQGVFALRGAIAELLKMPQGKVRLRYSEGAGCYGQNGADDAAGFAAIFSQVVKAPVRVQYMRADETGWEPKGPAMVQEIRAGVEADGAVSAWDCRVWSPNHNNRPGGVAGNLLPGILLGFAPSPPTFLGGERNATHNYTVASQRVTIVNQKAAVLRSSALRGLGAPQNTFANECVMDELSHAAGVDPLTFRLRHLRQPREIAVLEKLRSAWRPNRGLAFVHYENTQAMVAALTDVVVDRKTGLIRVVEVWIAHDCGLIVNPDGLRNQIEGNVLQGISRSVKEQVSFEPGGVTSVDWASYPILTFSEVPKVTIYLINPSREKILGAGEATTTVIAPAIANAVFASTGARLRRVPFTPDDVLAALTTVNRTS